MDGASNVIHEEPKDIEEPATGSNKSAESYWRECNLLSLGIRKNRNVHFRFTDRTTQQMVVASVVIGAFWRLINLWNI